MTFEPNATQEDVFEHCGIKKIVEMAVNGYVNSVEGERGETWCIRSCSFVRNLFRGLVYSTLIAPKIAVSSLRLSERQHHISLQFDYWHLVIFVLFR
jgi:hypothetical protein